MRKERIQPYLSRDVRRQLAAYSAQHGVTESAVVEAAILQFLTGIGPAENLFRRLDTMSRAVNRLDQKIEMLSQFEHEVAKEWLRQTPALATADARAINRQAKERHVALLARTAAAVSNGRHFIDELPRDLLDEPPAQEAAQ